MAFKVFNFLYQKRTWEKLGKMEAWMEDGDKVLVPEAYKGEVGSHGVIDGRCFK